MIKLIKSNLFFFILLFLVVFIVYGKSINFGITNLDDDTLVTKYVRDISNIKDIPKLFLTDCYYFKKIFQYYRPILSVSFALEAVLFKGNLKIYHLDNIILFALSLICIFIFLSKLNLNQSVLKFLVLLFAVHPVLSSVPVWIPARNDTLLIIFFILSLLNFINYLNTNKKIYLILYVTFFALSLFTKETTIFLVLIYPLLSYCFNIKFTKKQFFTVLISVLCVFVVYFFLRHISVAHTDTQIYLANWKYYLKNIIFGIMIYVQNIFYPKYISIMIYNIKPDIFTWIINIPLIVLLIIYFFISNKEKKKIILFALSFSFIAILPTFALKEYVFLPHRLVISLSGILIMLSLVFESLISSFSKTKKYLVVIFIFVFILFSFCSFINIDKYKDSFTYWYNVHNEAPNYYVASIGLAAEYLNKKDFEKAKKLALEAINLNKNIYNCMIYAKISFYKGEIELSKQILYQLLELNKMQYNIYSILSNIYLFEKDYTNAIECLKKMLTYSNSRSIGDKIFALERLAKVYAISGNYNDSLQTLLELIKYNKNSNYYFNISLLYEDLNDYDNSIFYIRKALEIEPDNKDYIKQLENIESKLSRE